MSIFEELKRRNVFKVGIAYLVGSWLLIQFADILLDNYNAPEWAFTLILVVLAVGFFITLFVAWAFEVTPEGIVREAEVDRSQSIAPQTGRKLNHAIVILLALAVVYLLFDKFTVEKGSDPISAQAPIETAATAEQKLGPAPSEVSRQSIAVLPFDNRSRNVDDEYFTEGIHDDLLTNLARISTLKVISRTSVNQYKGTEKTIPQIAGELGVATVMEGAVQRSGNTVRINVQLIDAKTDEHLWAEIFDRELTTENLFAIQSEISQQIADALEATLSAEEEQRISEFPTESMEAYNAYLRGRQLLPQRNSKDLNQAMAYFEEAVKLDPEFALAWVGIAESANLLTAHGSLNPDVQLQIMDEAINHALDINPQLGEAYVSKGSLLDELGQHEQAEAAYKRAIELSPNYPTAHQWYGILISSTNDRLQESLALSKKAAQLDPLSPIIKQNIASVYGQMGRFTEAESEYKQLLSAYPEFSPGIVNFSWEHYYRNSGKIDEAILTIQKSKRVDPGNIGALIIEFAEWLNLGDEDRAESVYREMEQLDEEHYWLPLSKGFLNIRKGQYAAAKEQANFVTQNYSSPTVLRFADNMFAWSGDFARAREVFLKNEPRYLDRQQWLEILNEGEDDICLVGLTLIKTGDEALGQDLLRFAANYWEQTAPIYIQHADRYPIYECHAYLGNIDQSLAALELSLSHQHVLSRWLGIAANPNLRMIQEDPRFADMDQRARAELTRQRENLARIEAEAGP